MNSENPHECRRLNGKDEKHRRNQDANASLVNHSRLGRWINHKSFFVACSMIGGTAVIGTILGGLVLAFDNSLWPIDAYVLYVGQASHLLCMPVSFAATLLMIVNPACVTGNRAWGFASLCWLILSVWMLLQTNDSFFVYGFPVHSDR